MRIYISALIVLMWTTTSAQLNSESYKLHIKRSVDPIQLDGKLDEESWKSAQAADDFWQRTPQDGLKAHLRTVARLTYDDQYLYVAMTAYDKDDSYIIKTLRRDESVWSNDAVGFVIDPIGERTNGFFFGTNTTGAQTDAQVGGGTGDGNFREDWDAKWYSETYVDGDTWTLEMAIPFKSLRYDPNSTEWLVNFVRADAEHNQTHVWAPVPRQFWFVDMGYAGTLVWDAPPPKAKSNIVVIPYVSASASDDFTDGDPSDTDLSTGVDAKIAVTPSLNLDLTVNPDFSQVEVDRQVTNLTRFSIFLPERRQFFLENSDLFADFGSPLLRPFFSRRIGLNDGRPVPIYAGARLSGNLTDDLRVGLLNVHTGTADGDLTQNYFTAAATQRVLKRSSISGFFVNRQSFNDATVVDGDYGSNAGLDLDYQSVSGDWQAWGSYYHSFKPGIKSQNGHIRGGVRYSGKVLNSTFAFGQVGTDFYADVGFVNRINLYNAETSEVIRQGYSYLFFPVEVMIVPGEQSTLQSYKLGIENFINYDPDYDRTESNHGLKAEIEFKSTAKIVAEANYNWVRLQYPFSFTDGEPIPADIYEYNNYVLRYESDNRALFNYKLGINTGGFYNGRRLQTTGEINYRTQPWGQFAINAEYNDLSFPDKYGSSDIWLIGSRAEISFSKDLFWTTFVQYNTQADNFNLNSRFQWQFKPLSWLFLVYTDDYLTPVWDKKYRSLVFKINYWLNL